MKDFYRRQEKGSYTRQKNRLVTAGLLSGQRMAGVDQADYLPNADQVIPVWLKVLLLGESKF